MSHPEYTLAERVPWPVARDSARAEPIQGGGLILTETASIGAGRTLAIVGRSCLSYVVEYELRFESAPGTPSEAVEHLTDALSRIQAYNRAPVPLESIIRVVRDRSEELLAGEWISISDNEFGETVRMERDPGSPGSIRLVYVVGL